MREELFFGEGREVGDERTGKKLSCLDLPAFHVGSVFAQQSTLDLTHFFFQLEEREWKRVDGDVDEPKVMEGWIDEVEVGRKDGVDCCRGKMEEEFVRVEDEVLDVEVGHLSVFCDQTFGLCLSHTHPSNWLHPPQKAADVDKTIACISDEDEIGSEVFI